MRGLSRLCGASAVQRVAQRAEERRQPLDVAVAERVGQHARDDDAILERVAGARGRLGAVAEHPRSAPSAAAHQVGGVQVQAAVAAARLDAVARAQEARVAEHQLGRQQPSSSSALRAVQIGQQRVEQPRALGQARLDAPATRSADDQQRDRRAPGPLHALRVAVDVVGDAVLVDQLLGLVPAPRELGRAAARRAAHEQLRQCGRSRPRPSDAARRYTPGGGR